VRVAGATTGTTTPTTIPTALKAGARLVIDSMMLTIVLLEENFVKGVI